jgi:hypothetical protein
VDLRAVRVAPLRLLAKRSTSRRVGTACGFMMTSGFMPLRKALRAPSCSRRAASRLPLAPARGCSESIWRCGPEVRQPQPTARPQVFKGVGMVAAVPWSSGISSPCGAHPGAPDPSAPDAEPPRGAREAREARVQTLLRYLEIVPPYR